MSIQIVKITESPRLFERYRVELSNGQKIDFGQDGEHAFIDHKDLNRRKSYMRRHLGNNTEYDLITNLIPSPSLMSFFLLWSSDNLDENIKTLNKLLKDKYG